MQAPPSLKKNNGGKKNQNIVLLGWEEEVGMVLGVGQGAGLDCLQVP